MYYLLQFNRQCAPFFFIQEPANLDLPSLKGYCQPAGVPGNRRFLQTDPRPRAGAFPAFLRCIPPLFNTDYISIDGDNLLQLAARKAQVEGNSQYQNFKPCKRQYPPESVQDVCNRYSDDA